MERGKRVILHDLPDAAAAPLFAPLGEQFVILNANQPAARCVGCFRCWLKTPGVCSFSDSLANVGELLLSSERLVLISRMVYGGLSVPVKRVLDRSIPGITPLFRTLNGQLHHKPRYPTQTAVTAVFYDTQSCTVEEKDQARQYIQAMSINYCAQASEVFFLPAMDFSEVRL